MAQYPALVPLDLSENMIGPHGTECLSEVLGQCALAKCRALAHLDLWNNAISNAGVKSLAGVLLQYRTLTHLNLAGNKIRSGGAESLAGVLVQCPVMTHLDFSKNAIDNSGSERQRLTESWSGPEGELFLDSKESEKESDLENEEDPDEG